MGRVLGGIRLSGLRFFDGVLFSREKSFHVFLCPNQFLHLVPCLATGVLVEFLKPLLPALPPRLLSYLTAAGILLAVMLLPFLVSSCCETMLKEKEKYELAACALGVSRWYAAATVILPASGRNILLSMILAIGRAMGETMAVMMVMGNANLFPRLLGKSESIASVIALEMGTAVYGSTHYHALYAAGMVLMLLLFLINGLIGLIRSRIEGETL